MQTSYLSPFKLSAQVQHFEQELPCKLWQTFGPTPWITTLRSPTPDLPLWLWRTLQEETQCAGGGEI